MATIGRPVGQAASDRTPTQAELDAEFQAQLDAEFQAQQAAPPQAPPAVPTIPAGAGLADPRFLGPPGDRKTLAGEAAPVVAEMVQQGALPAAGAMAGSLVAGPMGAPVLGPIGAMAGEGLNQALGITPPDAEQIGLTGMATAIPIPSVRGLRGAMGATRAGRRVAQEMAVEEAKALHTLIRNAQSADDLYTLVRAMGGTVDGAAFDRATAPLVAAQSRILSAPARATRVLSHIDNIKAKAAQSGGALDLQDLFETTRAIGREMREASGGPLQNASADYPAYQQLYKALRETIESVQTQHLGPGLPDALKAANAAFRREEAAAELKDLIAKVMPAPRAGDNAVQVGRLGEVLDAIQGDKPKYAQFREDFARAVSPDERTRIVEDLTRLNRTRPLGPAAGVERGSGRDLPMRVGLTGLGAAAGNAMAGPQGALIGGGAAAVLSETAAGLISEALLSARARPLLMRLLREGGPMTRESLALLNAAIAAGAAPFGQTGVGEQVKAVIGTAGTIGRDLVMPGRARLVP